MPTYIMKTRHEYKDYYFEWSTVTDTAASHAMTLEEFEDYSTRVYGERYMESEFQNRMERVEKTGCSGYGQFGDRDGHLMNNRMGPDETCLTIGEVIDKVMEDRREHRNRENHTLTRLDRCRARLYGYGLGTDEVEEALEPLRSFFREDRE